MFRKKFLTQRPQAMVQRAEQIRRLQQVRRILAAMDSPQVHAQDLADIADDGDSRHWSVPALH